MLKTLKPHREQVRVVRRLTFSLFLLLPILCSVSLAQTITSSGLNTAVSAPIVLQNGQTQFDITGGTRPGGGTNLFHSFGNFCVPSNNVANFLNNSGLPTLNILGRVNGGNVSNILGTIQTTGFGNANLFLMNPAGFLFGPNATLNVGGMVAFTSADYLRLTDGTRFNAIPNASTDVLLTAAPVAAFGFLGSNPGAITLQGSQLTVAESTGVSLVGGDITVEASAIIAPSGALNLIGVGRPSNPNIGGEVVIASSGQGSGFNPIGFSTFGTIYVSQGSIIDVSIGTSASPGSVLIRGGQIVLKESTLDASMGDGLAGAVTVASRGRLDIQNSHIDATSEIGFAGSVDLNAGTEIDVTGTTISASGGGLSPGGSITMAAPVISLRNSIVNVSGANLESDPIPTIGLVGTRAVKLNNSFLSADSTNACTVCDAGTVVINGGRSFTSQQSTISARPWFGHGGTIQVEANRVEMANTVLTTSTKAPDLATSVGGNITIDALQTTIKNSQYLSTATNGQGGTVHITSPQLRRLGAVIDASSQLGSDGTVNINGAIQP